MSNTEENECTCNTEQTMERTCENCSTKFTEPKHYAFRVADCKIHHHLAGAVCGIDEGYLHPVCPKCEDSGYKWKKFEY